jgi:PKD repeat protein
MCDPGPCPPHPSQVSTTPGQYILEVSTNGSVGQSAPVTFTVTSSVATSPQLSVSPASGNPPLTVSVTGQAGSDQYFGGTVIDYGDGSSYDYIRPLNSASPFNFSHTYNNAGTYTVRLLGIGENNGGGGVLASQVVTVANSVQNPPASLAASPSAGSAPLSVTFTSPWSAYGVGSGVWIEFGDGSQQSLSCPQTNVPCTNPVTVIHTYAQPGIYTAAVKSAPVVPNPITTILGTATISVSGQTLNPLSPSPGGPSTCPQISRTLSRGSRGGDVASLQEFLIAQGFLAPGNDSGYFGQFTKSAVVAFQAQYDLPQTGLVGKLTRAAISEVCN